MDNRKLIVVGIIGLLGIVAVAPIVAGTLDPTAIVQRDIPRSAGVEKKMDFFFGPYVIPPGQDAQKISIDLPVQNGFITAIAPDLIDAVTGETPSEQEMHIHHAHWFRLSEDPKDDYYTLNLAWVFGTGEEKTQGSFNDRSAAQPGGPRYAIYMPGGQPQTMIFMLHNKIAVERTMYILLRVTFVSGTHDSILAATGCPELQPGETCSAGQDFHAVSGRLWGSTFDVPRQPTGPGVYKHPLDIPVGSPERRSTDALGRFFVASQGGTAIATAGHLHPNGMETLIANLGPAGSGCEADTDGDGYPGVTIFHSRKVEHNPLSFPYSEDYQMGATQFGWRAPIHQGDRIAQFGLYANDKYPSYGAMSYAGLYVDRQQAPAPATGCNLASYAAKLINDPLADPTLGIQNHAWDAGIQPLCGAGMGPACDRPVVDNGPGIKTSVVHISAFAYAPGDMQFTGTLGAPPRIQQGQRMTFINDDVAIGVRHTVTSCPAPCNGPYVSNYPKEDGVFDSGKLGNLDYIDGGITGADTSPVWKSPADLQPGVYTYFCRIHPGMRGAFEVVAAT